MNEINEMNETTEVKTKKKLPLAAKIVIGLLCVVLVGGVCAFAYVQHYLGKINTAEPMTNAEIVAPEDETFEVDEPEEGEENEEMPVVVDVEELNPEDIELHVASEVMKDKDIVNILLIGQDRRSGEGRARSDSMILVTLNKKEKEIHMTSFMRDLYVEIPGNYSGNRLNAAYQFGGMELLNATLETNFGIQVDGNIEVDFNGFKACIDSVGGVDIELNQSEANYLNRKGNWDDNPASAGTWNLRAGMNHLTGEQALAYSRIRGIGNADYERTERQRRVLTDLFGKIKNADLKTVMTLADQIFPLLTTDISKMDLLGYAVEGLKIGMDDVATSRIPINGAFTSGRVRGMQVLVPNLEKNRAYLQKELYGK